jgi:chitinase
MSVAEVVTTKTTHVAHPRTKANTKDDVATATAPDDLSRWWGKQIPFKSLLASGALKKKSDGTYTEGDGYTMRWVSSLLVPLSKEIR